MSKAVLYIQWWLQRKDAAKSSAFLCLGFLAAAVQEHITKYVANVLEPIKTHIMPKVSEVCCECFLVALVRDVAHV